MSILRSLGINLGRSAPAPFVEGRRVELEMRNGRLVRGTVLTAGLRNALLEADLITPPDLPAYRRKLSIDYADVARWRDPAEAAAAGNWMPGHPGRAQAEGQTTSPWRAFR